MQELIINTIKEDINYIVNELSNIRDKEELYRFSKSGFNKVGDEKVYSHYVMDFRQYRSMVNTLMNTYDNFNKIVLNYGLNSEDIKFIEDFLESLIKESKDLHELKEKCKKEYDQYRCLNDSYIKIADKICRIERDRPYDLIHQKESIDLEASLSIALAESRDIVDIAESLGISVEKRDYQNALYSLNVELINWVKQPSYPIKISKDQRNFIKTLFLNVQNAKSILANKISSVKSIDEKEKVPMYIDFERISVNLDKDSKNMGIFSGKVIIYYMDKIITLRNDSFLIMDYANKIKNIIDVAQESNDNKEIVVYVDTHGFGISLYNELLKFKDINVKELDVKSL